MLDKRYRSASTIDSVVDLEKIRSGTKSSLEKDPSLSLSLTYLTEDLRGMLRNLSVRFNTATEASAPGLILAEGVKGQGKSHALLVAYHLFASPGPAKQWMEAHGFAWNPPEQVVVLVEKFTDQYLPFDSLWSYLAGKLDVDWSSERPPSLSEFRSGLGDRHLVLIFDELERGITNIADVSRRSQNLSFLQMVSEEANRNKRVTLIAAIYDGAIDPGATLKRVPRVELRFRKAEDRAAIVRHRLFTNANSYDRKAADDLIQSYSNAWQRLGVRVTDEYLARVRSSFPFLPELIDLIFERMGGGEVFQGTRGALGLLGAMLDAAEKPTGLLTGAHCKLTNQACADRLQDLDPSGTTIGCATGNLRDLQNLPYAEAIASATLLASLVPTGRVRGVSRDELVRHVAEPGSDPNQFEATVAAFRRYGSYFHKQEDRFYFDVEENEEAKVELEAYRSGNDPTARKKIAELWLQGLFKDWQQATIYLDDEGARVALAAMSKTSPRFVLAPRRLSNQERHALYRGAEMRNQIILLEPKDEAANHLTNPDLLAAAKRHAAAIELSRSAKNTDRQQRYDRIAHRERTLVIDALKQAGLVYVRIERWAETADVTMFEIEPLGKAMSREEVITALRTEIYPPLRFTEHLRDRLATIIGERVEQIDRLYRTTLGYPVPLRENMVAGALCMLVEDKTAPAIGLQGPRGQSFCGRHVDLTPSELDEAIVTAPWSEPSPETPRRPAVVPLPSPGSVEGQPTSSFAQPPPPDSPPVQTEELGTPVCRSLGELRQQLALRMNGIENATVQQVLFRVFARAQDTELSSFSAGIRGALTGKGSVDVQIELACPGPLTKAEVEARCEQLPQLPQSEYSARVRIIRNREGEET